MEFTEKRVRARWLKPPKTPRGETPLPRIFVSELVVDACDEELKGYLTQHFERVGEGKVVRSMEWASGRNARWQLPPASVYAKVERLSEYASWTLLHGYAVNHVALSLFQLRKMYPETPLRTLEDLETSFASNAAFSRIRWNESGGRIKRSPSGLLAQSALMSVPHRYESVQEDDRHARLGTDREDQEDIVQRLRFARIVRGIRAALTETAERRQVVRRTSRSATYARASRRGMRARFLIPRVRGRRRRPARGRARRREERRRRQTHHREEERRRRQTHHREEERRRGRTHRRHRTPQDRANRLGAPRGCS